MQLYLNWSLGKCPDTNDASLQVFESLEECQGNFSRRAHHTKVIYLEIDVQSVNCLDVILYRYHYGKGCLRLATRVENNSIVMPPSCYRVLQTPHFLEAPDKEVWKAIEWLRSSGKPCVWGSSQQCQTKQWISLLIGFVYAIPRAARKRHWTTSVRCCKWSFSAHRGTPVDNYAYIAALKKNMSRGSFKLLHVCQC